LVSSNLTSSLLDAAICESRRLESFLGELNPLSNRLGGVESALFTNQQKMYSRMRNGGGYKRCTTVYKQEIIKCK
jgi:hypothetical protein